MATQTQCRHCGHAIHDVPVTGHRPFWVHDLGTATNCGQAAENAGVDAPAAPNRVAEPPATLYQHLDAGSDGKGNPRRVFVVYSAAGDLLDVIDEGYAGRPRWLAELGQLPGFRISVAEYRELLTRAAVKS